jgi:photosystem II stability/assembly factor-like uncharacterized protein
MMRGPFSLALVCSVVALVAGPVNAQIPSLEGVGVPGLARNSVTNLHAEGNILWAGSYLNLTTDGGDTWLVADTDSLIGSRNTVFSIDVEGDIVWVGLGFSTDDGGASFPSAGGFLFSEDGGQTFTYRLSQLDSPESDTELYGASTLPALPIIVPQQSPPWDIDYDPQTGDVWMAGWASGIRKSTDQGRRWQRVVLPPDSLDALYPDSSYSFAIEPRRGLTGWYNYLGFSVLVDETGTVWAGTVAGVNRSTPDDVRADGERAWQRFAYTGTARSLTGDWVISIEEQPLPDRNAIWMATWDGSEDADRRQQYGVTVTRDGGETFEQVLLDEQVYDFAFRGTTVYVAGINGLFISEDDGRSWITVRDFYDPTQPDRVVPPDVEVTSVAVTEDGALWVGTSDGLFKSLDGGATWRVFRVEVPLHPESPRDEVPRVETFAYPNPFSPPVNRYTRIRYELSESRSVDIRIFDFAMNLVRSLVDESQAAGIREVVWDGTDDGGLRVANGTYFYLVDTGGDTFRGKILVIE